MFGVRQLKRCSFYVLFAFVLNRLKFVISFFPLADEEFDELCFEFGLELDEIVCIRYFFNILYLSSLHFIFVTLWLD